MFTLNGAENSQEGDKRDGGARVCGIGQRARSGNQLNQKLRIKANTAKVPAGVSLTWEQRFILQLNLLLRNAHALPCPSRRRHLRRGRLFACNWEA